MYQLGISSQQPFSTSTKTLYQQSSVHLKSRSEQSIIKPSSSSNTPRDNYTSRDSCTSSDNNASRVKNNYLKYFKFKRVLINVSGEKYETLEKTLNRYPSTLLGSEDNRLKLKDERTKQIFLNRNRNAFEAILFFYQSHGSLCKPTNLAIDDFEVECRFYRIPEAAIKHMKQRDHYLYKQKLPLPYDYNRYRYSLWQFIEYPLSPKKYSAILYFILSYVLMLSSIAAFCIESEFIHFKTEHFSEKHIGYLKRLSLIELGLNIFFAVELFIRFICFPWPKEFFKKPLNIFEFLSITLYLILHKLPSNYFTNTLLKISRVMRGLRLARFGRVSKHIKAATTVFKISINDLLVVFYIILLVCILCGSVMYYIEMKEPNTKFTSIPESMWWAIQTVLCLGYGDIVPTSTPGKMVGFFILYFGVTTVTVLVLALGGRFFDMYSKEVYKKDFLPLQEKVDYEIHYRD